MNGTNQEPEGQSTNLSVNLLQGVCVVVSIMTVILLSMLLRICWSWAEAEEQILLLNSAGPVCNMLAWHCGTVYFPSTDCIPMKEED